MAQIKGKQIQDGTLDLSKISGGSKVLPSDATLGSSKAVADITNLQEFTTKAYVDASLVDPMSIKHSPTSDVISTTGSTGIIIPTKPKGMLYVSVNGVNYIVGNGTVDEDFFLSSDGGTTAKTFSTIEAGDVLYFNPVIAGFELETSDEVAFISIV